MCSSFFAQCTLDQTAQGQEHSSTKTLLKPILKHTDTHNWYSYRAFQHQLWRSRGLFDETTSGVWQVFTVQVKRHLRPARAQTCSGSGQDAGIGNKTLQWFETPKMVIRDFRTEITVQESHECQPCFVFKWALKIENLIYLKEAVRNLKLTCSE